MDGLLNSTLMTLNEAEGHFAVLNLCTTHNSGNMWCDDRRLSITQCPALCTAFRGLYWSQPRLV